MRGAIRSSMWGLLSLLAVNVSAGFTGVSLGFGWLSGGAAILCGVPGVLGTLLLNAIVNMT